jgi:hypothetical protein
MRWEGSLEVDAIDVSLVRSTVPLFIDRFRRLDVADDQVVDPDSGLPLRHARVIRGVHPRVGAVYEFDLAVPPSDLAAIADGTSGHPSTSTTVRVELLADDDGSCVVACSTSEDGGWTLSLSEPRRPISLDVVGREARGNSCLTGGEVRTSASVDIAALAAPDGSTSVGGRAVHRWLLIEGSVAVEIDGLRWRATAELVARGRGALRPIVEVLAVAFRRPIRRGLDEGLADIATDVAGVAASVGRQPSPEALADEWLRRLLAGPSSG